MTSITLENEFIELSTIYDFSSNIMYEKPPSPKNNCCHPDYSEPKLIKNKSKENMLEINYTNYSKHGIILKTYKIPALKAAAKINNLYISGTKQLLIDRLTLFFNCVKNAIIIQRIFRGMIVRLSFKLRGPAFKNRSLCVNDTDFITLEPIVDICNANFFSYTDNTQFTYGFDIASLIQSIQKQNQKYNPYNREKIDNSIIENMKQLFNLSMLIYPDFKNENESNVVYNRHTVSNNRIQRRVATTTYGTVESLSNSSTVSINVSPQRNSLMEIRALTIDHRIQNLFIEIDRLGNYTQSSWFLNLDERQYIRLYRAFYEVWNYRSQLSRDMKLKIYPPGCPFDRIFPRNTYQDQVSLEQIKNACLIVFENLVYSGIDEDHRKIGTFHALSALTMVSSAARNAMPWLYEAVVY